MLITLLKKGKHILFFTYLHVKRKYRTLRGKPIIHVIGDSHSLLFQHEIFQIHHVGPATAFKLSSHESTTQSAQKIESLLNKLSTRSKSYLLFVFGEIDCRIHINKASKKENISLEQAISNTVDTYGKFLLEIQEKFPQSVIMVLNVLPAGEEKNIYNVKHYPSRDLHLTIVKNFNKQLENFCKSTKIIFIHVFDELIDKKEKRIKEYIFDPVHYNKRIVPFVIQKLRYKKIL